MSDDSARIFDEFEKKGYTDGLPIIPPTEARVAEMLEYTDRKPDDSLGRVPPAEYEATVESVAVNAVMAGCKPEYFPVVVTEIEVLLSLPNLRASLATTGPCWPTSIVNGPIAREIGMYSGWGVLGTGPNHRANLTIGRTMTLVCQNIGKSKPGISEKKPCLNAGRYGICFAENEAASPWEPLHVEKGFARDTSTVTGIAEGGRFEMLHGGRHSGIFAIDVRRFAESLNKVNVPNCNQVVENAVTLIVFTPGQAKIYSENGWTKSDVKNFLYDNCKSEPPSKWYLDYPEDLRENILKTTFIHTPVWKRRDLNVGLPLFPSPESIMIVVAGGEPPRITWKEPSHHGNDPAIIKPIAFADGTPVKSVYDFQRKK